MNGEVEIPYWMRLVMLFIDRLGFPIMAFFCMLWICYNTISKNTEAINRNTEAIVQLRESNEMRTTVLEELIKAVKR